MNKVILFAVAALAATPAVASAQHGPSGLPDGARPGQCYARVLVPAQFRDVPVDVVTQEASEQFEVTQATFRPGSRNVTTRDAYTRYEVTQPTFRTVHEDVETRPAYERLEAVQPTFATRSETVTIREPRLVWRRGDNLSGVRRLDPNTGEIYCLVEEQGEVRTITRRVQGTPGSVRRVQVPAETRRVAREVLATEGGVREVHIPAVVSSIPVQELAAPASQRRIMVPEQRTTINRQELTADERYEWVAVECDRVNTYTTPAGDGRATLVEIQRALAARGLYRGPIDGIAGSQTREATRQFQRSQGLPATGRLNIETVRALGL
jgi:Putative peptidoglycan binding domain